MKSTLSLRFATFLLLGVALRGHADIVAGPITNPSNGHEYYLLTAESWTDSEAEAESLGGTLAIIRNANEQKWVFSTFGSYGGMNRGLWIGLHKNSSNEFVWVTGGPTNFFCWGPGQPDNAGNNEDSVHLWAAGSSQVAGLWNDAADASQNWGVVEVNSKAKLAKSERELIGTWYEGGKIDRPCWIAGTENVLFIISNNRIASRAGITADGSLFAQSGNDYGNPMRYRSMPGMNQQAHLRGEILDGKILWSDGTWWSRKAVEYKTKADLQ